VVHHLEYRVFHRPLLHARVVDLDALEGHLCPLAETYILQDPSDVGFRGSVQAQGASIIFCYTHAHRPDYSVPSFSGPGLSDLERDYHLDVPRALAVH
jgi:hypothetical protein